MTMPFYNYDKSYTEGEDALWTLEQRESWLARYVCGAGRHDSGGQAHGALTMFERELHEFSSCDWQAPAVIDWMTEIAGLVSDGNLVWLPPKPAPSSTSYRDYLNEVVQKVTAEQNDPENFDEGHVPFEDIEAAAGLWVLSLTPYRIFTIRASVREAAREAMEEHLLGMAAGYDSGVVEAASSCALKKACKALLEEYEATVIARAEAEALG